MYLCVRLCVTLCFTSLWARFNWLWSQFTCFFSIEWGTPLLILKVFDEILLKGLSHTVIITIEFMCQKYEIINKRVNYRFLLSFRIATFDSSKVIWWSNFVYFGILFYVIVHKSFRHCLLFSDLKLKLSK